MSRHLTPVLLFPLIFTGMTVCASAGDERLPLATDYVINCATELGHHAYLKTYSCPINERKFRSFAGGGLTTFGHYLDWKPVAAGIIPLPVPVCPFNGFPVFKRHFNDTELDRYRVIVKSREYRRLFRQKHASHYLLARFLEFAGEEGDGQNRWSLMLVAAWEADNCRSMRRYRQYADETIDAAKARLQALKNSEELYWRINVIIPNLYRRTGRFEQAAQWLEGVRIEELAALKNPEIESDFRLAFDLLRNAIAEKNNKPVRLAPPQKPKEN